jgi:hypothetical protein
MFISFTEGLKYEQFAMASTRSKAERQLKKEVRSTYSDDDGGKITVSIKGGEMHCYDKKWENDFGCCVRTIEVTDEGMRFLPSSDSSFITSGYWMN